MHNVQCAYNNDDNILWSFVRCKYYLYCMLSVAAITVVCLYNYFNVINVFDIIAVAGFSAIIFLSISY